MEIRTVEIKTGGRGRAKKHVIHPETKEPILGLHYLQKEKVFYTYIQVGNRSKRKCYTTDLWESLALHEREQKKQEEKIYLPISADSVKTKSIERTVKAASVDDKLHDVLDTIVNRLNPGDDIKVTIDEDGSFAIASKHKAIDKRQIVDITRKWILDDFEDFKKAVSLPLDLDYEKIKTNFATTLDKVLNLYLSTLDDDTQINDCKNSFKWFKKYTPNNTSKIGEQEAINFVKQIKKQDLVPRSIKNIVDYVKAAFRYYKKKDRKEALRILDLLSDLKLPQVVDKPVKIISKDVYQNILKNTANPKYKTIWLVSLNCGLRQGDIITLQESYFDFKEKTYHNNRKKTGVIQAAMLMDETITAFQGWMAVRKQKGYTCKYLFCSDTDEQMREENVPKAFKRALKKAGENTKIKYKQLRQATETVPSIAEVQQYQIDILMGHKFPGSKSSYKARLPVMTKTAVEAIHDYYFD